MTDWGTGDAAAPRRIVLKGQLILAQGCLDDVGPPWVGDHLVSVTLKGLAFKKTHRDIIMQFRNAAAPQCIVLKGQLILAQGCLDDVGPPWVGDHLVSVTLKGLAFKKTHRDIIMQFRNAAAPRRIVLKGQLILAQGCLDDVGPLWVEHHVVSLTLKGLAFKKHIAIS